MVGAFALPGYDLAEGERLRALGVRDSKLLTPPTRREVYAKLRGVGTYATLSATPARIDRYVERGRLNTLEAELMAQLAVRLQASVLHVDACDPDAERFGRAVQGLVREHGREVTVLARHKADRDIPLVGAASIVAKVTRDRSVQALARRSGRDLGSGYPSDPTTRTCVRELCAGGEMPAWVRQSWKTVDTLKRESHLRPLEAFDR